MGQKVHPKIFRINVIDTWQSIWCSKKDYAQLLEQDIKIREYVKKKLKESGVAAVEIERSGGAVTVNIFTSKPGIVIGRGGTGVEVLRKEISKKFLPKKTTLNINIQEVTDPSLNAQLVAHGIIEQLEKRIPFRRTVKRSVEQVKRAGAKGVKIIIGGRLDGSEIARKETFSDGSIPLHTLRADINYAQDTAFTTYGTVGVKVWIYRGEVFKNKDKKK